MSEEQIDFAQISWGNEFIPGDRVRFNDELGTVKTCGRHAGTVFVYFDSFPERAQAVSPESLVRIEPTV